MPGPQLRKLLAGIKGQAKTYPFNWAYADGLILLARVEGSGAGDLIADAQTWGDDKVKEGAAHTSHAMRRILGRQNERLPVAERMHQTHQVSLIGKRIDGKYMPSSCPHCGAKLPDIGDAFCSECHKALDEAPATSQLPHQPACNAPSRSPDRIWYATESRVFGWLKFAWNDDHGVIAPLAGGLRFAGRTRTLQMTRLCAGPLLVWVFPWGAVASLLLGNGVVLLLAEAGAFNFLTVDNLLTYVVLGSIDVFAIASWPMRWIRVDFVTERGERDRAYFTVASVMGRWKDGVRRLYEQLQEWVRVG